MIRVVFLFVAAASLSGCALFQRDQCAGDVRTELRAVDARIAQARAEAQDSYAVQMPMDGGKVPFLCRKRGGDMVECTSLPSGKAGHDPAAHDPAMRLARLKAERQTVLARMMACQRD